ncbi:MAG: diguanylate cyclase [Magnetococcales bacterium]|nr:diguanylate cyclase [Magnetococcales bacterium]
MERVLVVENTRLFAHLLKKELETRYGHKVTLAASFAEAKEILSREASSFFAALLDLNLPDAPQGEIVDLVIGFGLPAIVFTGELSDELREKMLEKRVIDYVLKESASSIGYVSGLVDRISRNRAIKVLVVDDSKSARSMLTQLLRIHQFQVLEAESGVEALSLLEQQPGIRLVLTDYNMPEMDGFELTRRIRQKYDKNQMAVIGVSSYGNNVLSARFIKHGANDFINKPFLTEEFYVRVTQNIEIIEFIQTLQETSVRDYLTGLHNRRYFMEMAEKLHAAARRGSMKLAFGLLDVDFFKKVNDQYGHEAGDEVLRRIALILREHVRQGDLAARLGGEEFCLMLVNTSQAGAVILFERLRTAIANEGIEYKDQTLRVTASIGVSCDPGESLNLMMDQADQRLYAAKHGGRNKVVFEGE